MKNFNGKNVLFFCPKFFDYEKEIQKTFEELGAKVIWFDDRPSNGFFSKSLIRINKSIINNRIERYYEKILEKLSASAINFDYVFFLNPETITIAYIKKIRQKYSHAKFILYMWDSFNNRRKTLQLLPFFDSKFTFDPDDAKKYNLNFRPLFYVANYSQKKMEIKYDLVFVGTAHTDRMALVKRITAPLFKFNVKLYFFLSSKMLFWAKKITDRRFRKIPYKEISFVPLNHLAISNLIHQSIAVLDINHPRQIGLTMRTFEALGAQKKLITTNADVVNYDFYDQDNILIISRNNPIVNEDFLTRPFNTYSKEILFKYSIRGWLAELFKLV